MKESFGKIPRSLQNWRKKKLERRKGTAPQISPERQDTDSEIASISGETIDDSVASLQSPADSVQNANGGVLSLVNAEISDLPTLVLSGEIDVWAGAYETFKKRESELAADYEKYLISFLANADGHEERLDVRPMERVVTQQLEVREKKQWHFSLLGKSINIRQQSEKLGKFLLWSDGLVKSAVSVQPYAALAWSGVSIFLTLLTGADRQHEIMLRGFNSISRILVYWNICETQCLKHLEQEAYRILIGPLIELYSHIIEYQARTICHLSMTQLSRGWQKALGSNDWAAHMDRLESIHISCTNYIVPIKERETRENADKQLQAIQESQEILDEIRAIVGESLRKTQTNFEDQQERQLLENLAADHKSFKDFNPQRVQGTCEWFLNHDTFQQWRDSKESSLLWVFAGPGCGKSVLSRMLIDENRLSTNVTTSTVCYFFFKAGDSRRTHCTDALSSILHQLFMQDRSGSLIKIAKTVDKEYGKTLRENLSQLWELLLECAKSPDAGQIICVLDALDECDELSREQFLHKLKEFYSGMSRISSPSPQLNIFVTSRPYDEIEASFDEFTEACCVHLDGDEKLSDISHDIDLVIDDKVRKLSRLSPSDQKKISDRLKQMENRTYLWLYLTFNIIEKRRSQHSRRVDIEGLLSKLPSAVSDAYEQILNQSGDEQRARILLQIVLAAERPLTLNEANEILTLAFQTEEDPITTHAQLCSEKWPADTFPSAASVVTAQYRSKARMLCRAEEDGGNRWGFINIDRLEQYLKSHYEWNALLDLCIASDLGLIHAVEDIVSEIYEINELHVAKNTSGSDKDQTGADFTEEHCQTQEAIVPTQQGHHTGDAIRREGFATALQQAARKGHKDIVQLLLDHGVDIDYAPKGSETAQQIATRKSHGEIIQILEGHRAAMELTIESG